MLNYKIKNLHITSCLLLYLLAMNIKSRIKKNVALAPFTTFKIGGKAKFFIEVKTRNDLINAVVWAKNNGINFYILAGGSNVLINDKVINALVIKVNSKNLEVKRNIVQSGAGVVLGEVVNMAIQHNLSGLEWARGIPGTIGGAVRGNAAAFDVAIGSSIESIVVYDVVKNKFITLNNKNCRFGYKNSIVKENHSLIIWEVKLRLKKSTKKNIKNNSNKYLAIRKNHPKLPSAGCVFKNFSANYVKDNSPEIYQEAKDNKILRNKLISAGWLISRTDLPGKVVGGAQVSLQHANFIVNYNQAKAEDVIILIGLIKQKLRTEFNLQLQEEIEYIGFE
ncbi:MAG: UDP-N-acetylenolpyruvoylglucosamine reductase [Parcubacteria group bacterium ADurb.Bin316]|nr:MAG: UDP-N-acetylenolpyruvoylglucosamine reductase [Parcubacteria group bacterium ADurb.Bin316]